ncbi:hypothetical protein SDJN03_15111, partial [Cucurbita argyrosperma subsp. sororia]
MVMDGAGDGDLTESVSMFSSLPQPNSTKLQEPKSNPPSSESQPKKVVVFKPPVNSSLLKLDEDEEDDDDDEEEEEIRRRKASQSSTTLKMHGIRQRWELFRVQALGEDRFSIQMFGYRLLIIRAALKRLITVLKTTTVL